MKKIIIIFMLLFAVNANAEYKFAEAWDVNDTTYQLLATGLMIADWGQTRYIAKNPDKYYEINPILGKHPSTSEVNTYFAAAILGHALISLALPPKAEVFGYNINPRRIWQVMWIGIETGYVGHNASMGIRVKF